MVKFIVKRDGRKEKFDSQKIFNAIIKAQAAAEAVDFEAAGKVTNAVVQDMNITFIDRHPTVEEVQDLVEAQLIKNGLVSVAKKYILYRAERTKVRETKTKLMQSLHEITFKPSSEVDVKRENANIDGNTAMGTMLKYGSESSKAFYLAHVVNPRFSDAHANGDIHIHDLDFYSLTMTCCQIDLIKLFKGGFSTGNGFIREPNNIRSYASLACIAIQANQNDQHGGQSIPNFDFAMAEGVRKTYKKVYRNNLYKLLQLLDVTFSQDELKEIILELDKTYPLQLRDSGFNQAMTETLHDIPNIEKLIEKVTRLSYDETKDATFQGMEALIHNLNTMHSRAGAQVPFSSLNYGTDTSEEGRMVIDCLLEATIQGLGDGETPIFPIQIFKVKDGVSYFPEDPNYDLFKKAIYTSGKRLFPNFAFLDAPFNLKYYHPGDYNSEVVYMGCRTRVISNVHDSTREISTRRGNLSFTSINLPRIALKHRDIKQFYEELDDKMELIRDQLLERFALQCARRVYNFPFLMGQGIWLDSEKLAWDEEVREVIRHGTLSIGFIGLAETLKVLLGKHHGESLEAQRVGLDIISHMRKRCDEFAQAHHLNFSLLATPAEGLSGRFVNIDKKLFGVIPEVTDQEFYTNSFHIPVYFKITAFEKIKIEAPYHALTNAGHISYVEVDGDIAKNTKAFESIIRHMHDTGVGYGSVNHPLDRDPICGFNGIIDDNCPKCMRSEENVKFERIRRITGYLVGTLDRFNNAKKAEVAIRVKHNGGFDEN